MPPKSQELSVLEPQATPFDLGAEVVRWLFPAYIFIMLVAFFLLRTSLVSPSGNELHHDRAIFTAVNTATLTGFQLTVHPAQFSTFGKILVLFLTIAGTMFSLIVGGLAVKRILRLPWPDSRLILVVCVIQAWVLIIGAFKPTGTGLPGATMLAGMIQACAAWGNSGLYVGFPPGPTDLYTHVVLLPLALLGGLGITVLIEIFDALMYRRPLSKHAKFVLQATAILYLAGFIGYVTLQQLGLGVLGGNNGGAMAPWQRTLSYASQLSINARTAGMPLLKFDEIPTSLAPLILCFTMALMVIGASPGGTGGGLKTTTVGVLLAAPGRALKGKPLGRTFGIAAVWAGLYLITAFVLYLLLLGIEQSIDGDHPFFVILSAMSNVGLSHGEKLMIKSPGGHLVVSAAMLFGRLAPLLILWWMADSTQEAEVAVG